MIKKVIKYKLLKNVFRKIFFFFPVQLFFVHIKNNPILFIIWSIIVAIISKGILVKYGIPYLFLTPEYMGEVSFISFGILGFSFGGFIMAFNISSYITNGHRFPFIATLSRPFLKYFMNNLAWGVLLVICYTFFTVQQLLADGTAVWDILIYMAGFNSGLIFIILLSLGYFINTNKDFIKLFGAHDKHEIPIGAVLHKRVKVDLFFSKDREWTVETYLSSFTKISIARSIDHYDSEMLKQVFKQNHFNAALFEIAAIISVMLLSFGSNIDYFNIPAGASLTLMFTIFIMITSAIHSWFRGWASALLIAAVLIGNFASKFPVFHSPNKAYGMSYNKPPAKYSTEELQNHITEANFRKDFFHTLKILENWRKKNLLHSTVNKVKPKIVFINTTGGGMRSSMWSLRSMQYADSVLQGELLNHTQLITGSSGGMVGMSYLRELYLQEQEHKISNLYDDHYVRCMNKDVLNRVGFVMTVNDLLIKLRSFKDGENEFKIDRGYAFEQQLNENLEGALSKRLHDYYLPEYEAKIPMAIISPTIVSDGRRLLISPQPISYLSYTFPQDNIRNNVLLESVEFKRFFKNQDADNLRFSTALRMTSTFPYIMPIVSLPSSPPMKVMDSGLRDNYGTKTSLKFLYTFRHWIERNTSGVIILQIRDTEKKTRELKKNNDSFITSISSPIGNIYKNLFITQDYEHDQLIQYASEWFEGTIDIIDFSVDNNEKKQLSLSWHLTEKEKKQIYNSIHSKNNQESLSRLKELINNPQKK
ncbi:MAG: hypothetical protein ACJAZ2_001618 [Glaciecola sp.]|jgi:hypothetical protein